MVECVQLRNVNLHVQTSHLSAFFPILASLQGHLSIAAGTWITPVAVLLASGPIKRMPSTLKVLFLLKRILCNLRPRQFNVSETLPKTNQNHPSALLDVASWRNGATRQ